MSAGTGLDNRQTLDLNAADHVTENPMRRARLLKADY